MSHLTRTPVARSRSKVNLQGAGAYCGGLPHSLFLSCCSFITFYFTVSFSLSALFNQWRMLVYIFQLLCLILLAADEGKKKSIVICGTSGIF